MSDDGKKSTLKDWAAGVYGIGVLAFTAILSENHGLIRSFFEALIWPILITPYIYAVLHGRF
jgi:hypothetical protein